MKKATRKRPKSLILLEARAGVEPTYTDLQSISEQLNQRLTNQTAKLTAAKRFAPNNRANYSGEEKACLEKTFSLRESNPCPFQFVISFPCKVILLFV